MICVGTSIMCRNALVALRIDFDGLFRRDESDQLRLDPLEACLERRIGLPVPGRILLVELGQCGDALAG